MNLPIDVVVELVSGFAHSLYGHCGTGTCNIGHRLCMPDGRQIAARDFEDLRSKLREYLLTLIPKPKLLSECEEYKNVTTQGETIVYRVGNWKHYSENVPCSPE